jgi:Reverse transcriptase (RNA-dependent DNA polymerase)
MEAEVEWAIKQLKDNKAPGQDGIPIEMIKAGDGAMTKTITKICNTIWATGKWPEDWKSSVFIPIFKKGDAKDCENYRTIAMISHISKILLKIIHKRMESTIERELPDSQAGFRKARGTRDHIANMRWIMERQREYGQKVYICFIDYSKAFDCINHELMWKTLIEMGIPRHLIQLLKGLYEDQIAVIRTEYGDTDRIRIKKGVRQGCILSPFLFNLYAERIMRLAGMDEAEEGVKIAGRTVNNLRYADDTTLLAGKKIDLVEMIRRLKRESEKAGLYFNIKKTKIMTTGEEDSFEIDGEEIETVTSFTFLGSVIEREGKCDTEIKRRVAIGKAAMNGLEKIWKDKHVSIDTKKRLVRALIIPTVTYGSETWTMTKKMRKKINACEMWIWRKMQRISWTEKRTNDWVRVAIGIENEETLQQTVLRTKLRFFGHVMRSDGLEKEMMLACGEGRRKQGRPRKKWMDEIHEATGMKLSELRDATAERGYWRHLIMTVARVQETDSTR